MEKKTFLAGIISFGLVFTLIFAGCPTDGDNGNGGGGSADNPLLGTWVNDLALANLTNVFIFTDESISGPGIAAGTKLAYYASTGGGAGTDYTVNGQEYSIPVGGRNYRADITSLGSNKFTLTGYVPVVAETNPDGKMDFKRAPGTSGSQLQGVWVRDTTSWGNTNATLTIILIGGSNKRKVWSATGGNASDANYRITEDAGTTYISWNGGAPASYTKRTIANSTTLSVPPPAGGVDITVNPLFENPTF